MSDQELETVASVIARLGAPPPDIADLWMADAQPHVSAGAEFDVHSPVWQRMMVDNSGRARLAPPSSRLRSEPYLPSQDQPSRVLNVAPEVTVVPEVTVAPELVVPSGAEGLDDLGETKPASPCLGPQPREVEGPRIRVAPTRNRRRAKVLVCLGLLTLMAVAIVMFFTETSPPPDADVEIVTNRSLAARRDIFSPDRLQDAEAVHRSAISRSPTPRDATPGSQHSRRGMPASLARANGIDSLDAADTDTDMDPSVAMSVIDMANDRLNVDLSLDAFLPAATTRVEGESTPRTAVGESSSLETIRQTVDITDLQDEPESVEQIVPQPTAAAHPPEPQTTAVTLPSPPATNDVEMPPSTHVLAVAVPPARLQLEFPVETQLGLQITENGWHVTAGDQAALIGIFEMAPDTAEDRHLQFRWLGVAADSPLAAALAHGRLRTGEGDVVYLRPQLHAPAVVTGLSERDTKLKWMLGGPLLNVPTRLRFKLEAPDDVAVEWIEAIDEDSPQRARGIAVLTLKDSVDSGALAVRVEVRGSNSIAMRLRYGARLAPGLPWQWADAKWIRTSLDAATQQLQIADDQLLQLETAIARAKKIRARRQEVALEIQRDAIEEAVRSGTLVAKRLAELDQLVALLQADGRITVNLQVQWPDGDIQTLLSLDDH